MINFKKTLFLPLVLILLAVQPVVFARNLPPVIENLQLDVDFEQLSQKIITAIDKTIEKINSVESKVINNPDVSEETKASISSSLDEIENILLSYKSKVEAATTLEELQAINQEIISYLKANKDVFKENIQKAIIDLAEKAAENADEFKAAVEKMLATLKVTCPSEKETIAALEAELQQLEEKTAVLRQAIQSQDTQTMKQEIAKLNEDIKSIIDLVKKLEAACF